MKSIYINGKIYTEDPEKPWAQAVVIEDEEFIYVGDEEGAKAIAQEDSLFVDLQGRTVIPGLLDGHTHPYYIANTKWRCTMPFTHDRRELMENIRTAVRQNPISEKPYLFLESFFPDTFGAEGPDRWLLDDIISDRPCRVQDFSDHACWLNTAALSLLLNEEGEVELPDNLTMNPEFVKNEKGEYTGWVLEPDGIDDVICEKIGWKIPPLSDETVNPLLDFFKAHGITGLMEAETRGEENMRYFYEKDMRGELGMYYHGTVILTEPAEIENAIATALEWKKKYTSKHCQINVIKFFIDGTNELGDCLSLTPFANDTSGENHGAAYATEEEMKDVMIRINAAGLDFHVHTICDGAFRLMCNAYEKAKEEVGEENWNMYLTLAHCEIMDPEDIHRVAELGIFLDWSTHWSGGYFGDASRDYLGEERFNRMYDFTGVIQSGGMVGFSSDAFTYWEVERANPFFGMQVAMTRVDPAFPLNPGKYPGSIRPPKSARLSLTQLLRGYTYNNAVRMRMIDHIGTIECGKKANMVVLNKDIFAVEPEHVSEVEPEYVVFEGKKRTLKSNLFSR